jgi:hypothetical protein
MFAVMVHTRATEDTVGHFLCYSYSSTDEEWYQCDDSVIRWQAGNPESAIARSCADRGVQEYAATVLYRRCDAVAASRAPAQKGPPAIQVKPAVREAPEVSRTTPLGPSSRGAPTRVCAGGQPGCAGGQRQVCLD